MRHDLEHLDFGIDVLNHNPLAGQLPIDCLIRFRQRLVLTLLDRYQTPRIIVVNALITTVRQNQHRQIRCQNQQTRLAQREVMHAARCLIDIINQTRNRICNDLGLDGMSLFLAGIPIFLFFLGR